MKITYVEDALIIRLSDKPITRVVAQERNAHISYAADGTVVEVVILEAKANGMLPIEVIYPV
jgi:Protein of unknown function (DUF2283)